MKSVKINQAACIGCGTCTALCSGSFVLNGATASPVNPPTNTESEIDTAIASCPTQSISWEEATS